MTIKKDTAEGSSLESRASLDSLFERLGEVGSSPKPFIKRSLPVLREESTDTPVLMGLPSPTSSFSRALNVPDRDELSPAARSILSAVRQALVTFKPGSESAVFALDDLAPADRDAIWDMLGEGEVAIVVTGASRYEIDETSLPGVYRVRTKRPLGDDSLHLEVGPVPAIVLHAAESATSPDLPIEDPPPPGLMNAQPLLAEVRHRMQERVAPHSRPQQRPSRSSLAPSASAVDEPNHVVSLTLLPLNEADGAYLARALGSGPIQAESRGYGTCKIAATARRSVWSVQYFNAMDTMILDTLEIGSVPAALEAAPMDLEDSGVRLSELLGEAPPATPS